ncbi:MAG: 4Fe-4S binding protein [Planctomycetes bacterium]|nr:4Fe-4S binding protein [Planctomycetota bacterium]
MTLPVSLLRRAVQLVSFLVSAPWLAMGFLRCPFGVPFVSCLSCPMTDCRGQWLWPWALAALLISQLALARSFCGWLCPLGFILDAVGYPVGRRGTKLARGGKSAWRFARWAKYAMLVAVVAAVLTFDRLDSRAYDYVVRSPRLLDIEAVRVAVALGLWRYTVRLGLLVFILVSGVVVARFWCRYLCPLGALLALVRRLSLQRLRIRSDRCSECHQCVQVCPMATVPGAAECTACYECADRCRHHAIEATSERRARDDGRTCPPAADDAMPGRASDR